MKKFLAVLYIALMISLCGCGAIRGAEGALNDLASRIDVEEPQDEEPEPDEFPGDLSADETPDPDADPLAFGLGDPEDAEFGFYSALQEDAPLPITPDGLVTALKEQGVSKLPTADGVSLTPRVNRLGQCYALELAGTRESAETQTELLYKTALSLKMPQAQADACLLAVRTELEKVQANALFSYAGFDVRVADMRQGLRMMISVSDTAKSDQ